MFYNVITPSLYGPMLINRHDTVVGYNISMRGAWMATELELLRKLALWASQQGKPVCFVDGGANVGMHSLAMAGLRLPNMRCFAMEAQRSTYYQLCGTLALNSLSHVIALHRVLAKTSGELLDIPQLEHEQPANFGAFAVPETANAQTAYDGLTSQVVERVASLCLDDVLAQVDASHATIIKLDIEGMEPLALAGASAALRKLQPALYVEYAQCSATQVLNAVQAAFDGPAPYRAFDMPEKNLLLLPKWCDGLVVEAPPVAWPRPG